MARLVTVLGRERLVTLTGVGGIGKTRLGLAVAAALAPSFADGCWFAELAPAGTEGEVVQAMAAALGAPVTDRLALARYVADRQLLVVLDNCEHVLADAARLARALLEAGPEVVIVATSREPLGVDGEVVRGVASLASPEADDVAAAEALESSAVRLFVARAAAAADGFVLDDANVAAVAAICRHLDGIPLAIELAAARVRSMPPAEIARRLGERFRLLAAGRGAQERHRTLQAALSWSHELLSDEERQVFRRLAVFPASFDLQAAERVAAGDGTVDVVGVVVSLVDRSLVQYEPSSGRYRLLETLRQYAADRLAEAGETLAARDAHCACFVDLIDSLAPHILDSRYGEASRRLMTELDNLRTAASWLADTARWDDLQRIGRAAFLFLLQFSPPDGRRWLEQAIGGSPVPEDQDRVDALGALAYLVVSIGDTDAGIDLANRSIQLAAGGGLPASPWAWATKSLAGIWSANPQTSVDAAREGLNVAADRHDELTPALLETITVGPLAALGHLQASQAAADKSLAMAAKTGNGALVGAAVTSVVSSRLYNADPDFAGALEIIDRNEGLHHFDDDNLNGLWLALMRALALSGLREGASVSLIGRCLRIGDRLQLLPAVELALRLLVLEAATGGQTDTALSLLGYLTANVAAYRGQAVVWLDERIEQALSQIAAEKRTQEMARGADLTRRELMGIIATVERTLTPPA